MTRQLENSHDPNNAQHTKNRQRVTLRVRSLHDEVDVERQYGQNVDDVERALQERDFIPRASKAQNELQREPGVA